MDYRTTCYLINVGRSLESLRELRKTLAELNLSKHNPYWHSSDEETANKLYDIRCKLVYIEEQADNIFALIEPEILDEMGG